MIDENKLIIEIEKRNTVFTEEQMDLLEYLIEKQSKVGEWIPCSERLPQRQDRKNTFLKMYLVQSKRGVIHMGFRDEEGIWRTIHGNRVYNEVAWQPLPEPYKEGDT